MARGMVLPSFLRSFSDATQFLPQPLHLCREAVDHAPLVPGPHVAVWRMRADAVLLPGSPESVVGEDVGHVLCSRIWNLPAGVGWPVYQSGACPAERLF